jgi:hypothetical protein
MRVIWVALAAALVAACATVGFQPYEDTGKVYEGSGGVKLEVEGVDFWTEGAPPRRYSILGVVMQQGSGIAGDDAATRGAVVKIAKQRGADAAIQVHGNSALKDVLRPAQDISAGTGIRRLEYALIRYVP